MFPSQKGSEDLLFCWFCTDIHVKVRDSHCLPLSFLSPTYVELSVYWSEDRANKQFCSATLWLLRTWTQVIRPPCGFHPWSLCSGDKPHSPTSLVWLIYYFGVHWYSHLQASSFGIPLSPHLQSGFQGKSFTNWALPTTRALHYFLGGDFYLIFFISISNVIPFPSLPSMNPYFIAPPPEGFPPPIYSPLPTSLS